MHAGRSRKAVDQPARLGDVAALFSSIKIDDGIEVIGADEQLQRLVCVCGGGAWMPTEGTIMEADADRETDSLTADV